MPKRKKAIQGSVSTQDLRQAADAAYQLETWDEVIELYTALLSAETTPDGQLLLRLGRAHYEKGEYDKAIDFYQQALDTPGFDTPGRARYSMGRAYDAKSEHDKAIECYQKALDTPGYDRPGRVLNSMGLAYRAKSDYDKAIECYQKALDTPGYDKPGHAWFNTGIAYKKKGDLASALRAFEKAARAYRKAGTKAMEDNALAQAELVRVSRQVGTETAADLFPALSAATSQGDEPDSYDPLDELRKLECNTMLESSAYVNEYKARDETRIPESALAFLKGWSSSEPFAVSGSTRERAVHGGGLFLRWKGKGVVIDPGIGFVSHFHNAGFFVQDIDAIVVTHDHVDHTFDLPAIVDLAHLTRSEVPQETKRYCVFSWPVVERFPLVTPEAGYTFGQHYDDRVDTRNAPRRSDCIPGVKLVPFHTEHEPHSFGVKFHLKRGRNPDIRIGVTSDTLFRDEIAANLADCHIIVAHMSSPDAGEYTDPHYLKQDSRHLGLNGTRKLIENTRGEVYCITEFWAGRGDRRVPLCQKLAYDLKRVSGTEGKCIIPADVGLMIQLDSAKDGKPVFSVRCTSCGNPVQCCDVTVVRPDEPYGPIRYICPDCMSRLTLPIRWTPPSSSLPGPGRSRPGESSGE